MASASGAPGTADGVTGHNSGRVTDGSWQGSLYSRTILDRHRHAVLLYSLDLIGTVQLLT